MQGFGETIGHPKQPKLCVSNVVKLQILPTVDMPPNSRTTEQHELVLHPGLLQPQTFNPEVSLFVSLILIPEATAEVPNHRPAHLSCTPSGAFVTRLNNKLFH